MIAHMLVMACLVLAGLIGFDVLSCLELDNKMVLFKSHLDIVF